MKPALLVVCVSALVLAQENAPVATSGESAAGLNLDPGTRIPLSFINSVSTKNAAPGDRVYLESVFPIVVNGKVVVPPGSYVSGTITSVKRPGRIKGRGELFVRFDTLTLPNGVTRDFRSAIGQLDGRATERLNKEEGKVQGDSNKGGDLATISQTTVSGASIGALAGIANRSAGMGLGIGAGVGAAAGLVAVLLTRGPDAMLARGTVVEMVLDRPLSFAPNELQFESGALRRPADLGPGPSPQQRQMPRPPMGRRWPF